MEKYLITRRHFLVVCAGILGASCRPAEKILSTQYVRITNIEDLKEGFNHFPLQLLGIFRSGLELKAISLSCTHQKCPVTPQEGGFVCKCHGSQFASDGTVLSGPADRSLLWLPIRMSENGDISVLFGPEQSG